MKRYQLSTPYEKKAFPIKWNELPDELLQAKIPFYELFEFRPGIGLKDTSVLYFKSVRKVKEGFREIEDKKNKIIYLI